MLKDNRKRQIERFVKMIDLEARGGKEEKGKPNNEA